MIKTNIQAEINALGEHIAECEQVRRGLMAIQRAESVVDLTDVQTDTALGKLGVAKVAQTYNTAVSIWQSETPV